MKTMRATIERVIRLVVNALVILVVAGTAVGGQAEPLPLKLARVFTSNAVLQRSQSCPVFGLDVPGSTVTVVFAGQKQNATADARGLWRVSLAPLPACATPQTLTVNGSARIALTNILVGDVWLISGQSNADWPLRSAAGGRAAMASATNTLLRYLQMAESPITTATAWTPAEVARLNPNDYFSGVWQVSDPASAGAVSAVGYLFAHHIQTNQNIPIGLIDCTVGGTMAESWMPTEAINANPRLKAIADNFLDSHMVPAFAKTRLLQNLARWDAAGRPVPMPEHPYKPGACWRNGLSTIAPFALRGLLWYQGETNADFEDPSAYDAMAEWHTETFRVLVAAWRNVWENEMLPVYFVQLPRLNRPSWPWFRESQLKCAQTVPHTAMVVAFDCGDPANVHPVNKQPVADRLARIARARTYGEDLEWSGPQLRSWRIQGTSIVLEFDHAEGGLVSSDGHALNLFTVAGANRRFFPATASISNHALIVSAPQVPRPVAARYAWVPTGDINFCNGAGLPASPFRTDDWTIKDLGNDTP